MAAGEDDVERIVRDMMEKAGRPLPMSAEAMERMSRRIAEAPPMIPPPTLHFLQGLSPEDIKKLHDLLRSQPDAADMLSDYRSAKTIWKFLRIAVMVIAGAFGTSYAAVKAGIDIFGWVKGVGK